MTITATFLLQVQHNSLTTTDLCDSYRSVAYCPCRRLWIGCVVVLTRQSLNGHLIWDTKRIKLVLNQDHNLCMIIFGHLRVAELMLCSLEATILPEWLVSGNDIFGYCRQNYQLKALFGRTFNLEAPANKLKVVFARTFNLEAPADTEWRSYFAQCVLWQFVMIPISGS